MIVDDYILFDFPGQVELFTHHGSVKNILEQLQKVNYRVRLNFFLFLYFKKQLIPEAYFRCL
jgi:GTPase SAR1 family protein